VKPLGWLVDDIKGYLNEYLVKDKNIVIYVSYAVVTLLLVLFYSTLCCRRVFVMELLIGLAELFVLVLTVSSVHYELHRLCFIACITYFNGIFWCRLLLQFFCLC
jgi:hypothetical protein